MDDEEIITRYVEYARGAGFPGLDLKRHREIIDRALGNHERHFYYETLCDPLLPFTEKRGRLFVNALREEVRLVYDLSHARPRDMRSPALEGKWYRARSYALTCRKGRFPRVFPPTPGKPPEMVTLEEWWVEASTRQVVEYALEGEVLEGAARALLALTPEPERRRARESPPPKRKGKEYRVKMLHPFPAPPMPEEAKDKVLAFARKYGCLGLLFRDVYAFSAGISESSPPQVETRVVLGPLGGRVGPPSLPLAEYFHHHLRDPAAVYKEEEIQSLFSPVPVRGRVLDRRALFREYREAVHEIYFAAWDFKRACYTLQGTIEDPFGLDALEEALSRCQLRLSRKGGVRFILRPRCLLDALYLHVAQGNASGGLTWRKCRGCGREFIPRGRERYCTQQCRSRTNVRRWREKNIAPTQREPGERGGGAARSG